MCILYTSSILNHVYYCILSLLVCCSEPSGSGNVVIFTLFPFHLMPCFHSHSHSGLEVIPLLSHTQVMNKYIDELSMATYLSSIRTTYHITPKGMICAYGSGLHRAFINKPAVFFVDGTYGSAIEGQVHVSIEGVEVTSDLVLGHSNLFKITYMPSEVRKIYIHVRWGHIDIDGSPFVVQVVDPEEIRVVGMKKETCWAVHRIFTCKIMHAYDKRIVSVVVRRPDGATQHSECHEMEDGSILVTHKAKYTEQKCVEVRVGGQHVHKSPYTTYCVDPERCSVVLFDPPPGQPVLFGTTVTFKATASMLDIKGIMIHAHAPSGKMEIQWSLRYGETYEHTSQYTPNEVGRHIIFFQCAGVNIQGSPIIIDFIRPELCLLDPLPPYIYVGSDYKLVLCVRGAGETVPSVTSSIVDYLVPAIAPAEEIDREGEFDINLHGVDVGVSNVGVFYGNFPVKPSPDDVWVVDYCRAFGDALVPGQFFNIENPIEFYVDIHRGGPGELSVKTTGPNKKSFPCALSEAVPEWEGTEMIVHTIQFTPHMIRYHYIDCLWTLFGLTDPIPDSPFKFYVVDPPLCQYYRLPKDDIIFMNTNYTFCVDTNPAGEGAPIHVFVRHEPDDGEPSELELTCERSEDDKFYYTINVNYLGWMHLWTQYNYTDIRPKPRKFRVEEGVVVRDYLQPGLLDSGYASDPTKCRAFGEVFKPNRFFNARSPIEFYVDVMSSGFGYLSSEGLDPDKEEIPVYVSPMQCSDEEWVHTLVFTPFIIDEHSVDVLWNMVDQSEPLPITDEGINEAELKWWPVHIPKSPVTFPVVDPPKCQLRGLPRETYVIAFKTYDFDIDTKPAGLGAPLRNIEEQIGIETTTEGESFAIGQKPEMGVFGFKFTLQHAGWLVMTPQYNYTPILPRPLAYDIVDPKMYTCDPPTIFHTLSEVYHFPVINAIIHDRYLRYRTTRHIYLGEGTVDTPMLPVNKVDSTINTGFQPEDIGMHEVEVTCVGYHVNNSPFIVNVCCPPWCVIDGLLETPYIVADQPWEFSIDTNPAFPGAELTVIAKHSEETEVNVLEKEEVSPGVFKFCYIPHRPAGYLQVSFLYNGHHIRPPMNFDLVDPWQYVSIRPLGYERIRYGVIFNVVDVTIHHKYISCSASHKDEDQAEVELFYHNEILTCSFQPRYVGYYHTEVKCCGFDVPGSPFDVPVCDPESCYVSGVFPLYILVDDPTLIPIFTEEAGPGDLTVHFDSDAGPSALKLDLSERKENGCETITFYANTVCDNKVTLRWADFPICGSPLEMRAIDPSKLKWVCTAMRKGRIILNRPTEFSLDCREVGNVYPNVTAVCDETPFSVQMTGVAPRTFTADVLPTVKGEMLFNITFGGFPTPGFPITVIVRAFIDPNSVHVTGRPLKKCYSSLVEEVTVHTPEIDLLEAEVLNVAILPKGRKYNLEDYSVRVEMSDNLDTTYRTRFLIPEQGPHYLNCMVEGQHCRGSPYKLNAIQGPNASKCILYGRVKEPYPYFVIDKLIRFQVDVADAGNGVLNVVIKDAFNKTIPSKLLRDKKAKRAVYEVEMVLPTLGVYSVNVTWSDYPIPGSPFTIYGSNPLLCSFRDLPDPAIPDPDAFAPVLNRPFTYVMDSTRAGKGIVAGAIHYDSGDVDQLEVVEDEEGVYSVTASPRNTGWMEMILTFNDVNILPGKWYVYVVDPSLYSVSFVDKIMRVRHPVPFHLEAVSEGTPYITLTAYHETGEKVKGYVEFGQVNSTVKFIPKKIGDYHVNVNCGGVPLRGGPFSIQVCDPDACKVIGHIAEVYVRGEKSLFQIDTLKAGPGTFAYSYEQTAGDEGTALEIDVRPHKEWHMKIYEATKKPHPKPEVLRSEDEDDNQPTVWGNDVYDVKFSGNVFGAGKIALTWAGYRIARVPYHVNVYDPANCIMSLPVGGVKVKPKVSYTFYVDTYLAGSMLAEVRALMLEEDCHIVCEQEGKTTKVVFTADYPGDYPVEVRCYRVHVQGSPFTIKVTDQSLIDVVGFVPSVMPVGGVATITVDCIEAGAGPLESNVETIAKDGPPADVDIKPFGEHVDRYEVTFVATAAGECKVQLTWGGHNVPQFPHNLRVVDLSACRTVLFRPPRGYYVEGEKLQITISNLPHGVPVDVTVFSPQFEATVQQWPKKDGSVFIEYLMATVGTYRVEAYAFNILLSGFPLELDAVEPPEDKPVLPLVMGDEGLQILTGPQVVEGDQVEASAREIRRTLLIRQSYAEKVAISAATATTNVQTDQKKTRRKSSSTVPPPVVDVGGGLAVGVVSESEKKTRRLSRKESLTKAPPPAYSSIVTSTSPPKSPSGRQGDDIDGDSSLLTHAAMITAAATTGAIVSTVTSDTTDSRKPVSPRKRSEISPPVSPSSRPISPTTPTSPPTSSGVVQPGKRASVASRRTSTAEEALKEFAGKTALGLVVGGIAGELTRSSPTTVVDMGPSTEGRKGTKQLSHSLSQTQFQKAADKTFNVDSKGYIAHKLSQTISGIENSVDLVLFDSGLAEQGKLQITLKSTSGRDYPVTIADNGLGKYSVSFTAEELGEYKLGVLYEGVHVLGSPYTFTCAPQVDLEDITASGPIVDSPEGIPISENEVYLKLDTTVCGPGNIAVEAEDDNAAPIPHIITEEDDPSTGKHYTIVSIDVYRVGIYVLELYYHNAMPLPNSPYKVNIVNPGRVKVNDLPPKAPVTLSETIAFVVDAVGAGFLVPEVSVCDPTGTFSPIDPRQTERGYFVYKYTPEYPGAHSIHIKAFDEIVGESPYGLSVLEMPSSGLALHEESLAGYQGTYLVDQVAKFEFSGVPIKIDMKELSAKAYGPNTEIAVNVQFVPGAIYEASFIPTEPGLYHVFVECAGHPVEGSPFVMGVADPKKVRFVGSLPKYIHVNQETVILAKTAHAGVGKVSVMVDSTKESKYIDCRVIDLPFDTHAIVLKGRRTGSSPIVEIQFADRPIPNCIFGVEILNPYKCQLEADCIRTKKVEIGEVAMVTLSSKDNSPLLDVVFTVNGPSSPVEVITTVDESGDLIGRFTPWEVGQHTMEVSLGGVKLGQGQYRFVAEYTAADHSGGVCRVAGPGIRNIHRGEEARFVIATGEKGLLRKGNISADVKGVSHEVPARIVDNENGTYSVSYTPPNIGAYLVNVKHKKKAILGSPFKLTSLPPPDPSQIAVYGEVFGERARFIAGDPIEFNVDVSRGGDGRLTVFAHGPSGQQIKVYTKQHITDEKKYTVLFDPTEKGIYSVAVLWSDKHISRSPFKFGVHPGPDASKVIADGPGLHDDILGSEGLFIIDAKQAGTGSVSVRVHGTDKFHVNLKPINPPNLSLLKATYTPTQPGEYTLFVRWCGRNVPGSPFRVNISRGDGDGFEEEEPRDQDLWNFKDDSNLIVTRPEYSPKKGKPPGFYLDLSRQDDVDYIVDLKSRAKPDGKSDKTKRKYKSSKSKADSEVNRWPNYRPLLATSQVSIDTEMSVSSLGPSSSDVSSSEEGVSPQRQPRRRKPKSKHRKEQPLTLKPAKAEAITFGEIKDTESSKVEEITTKKKGLFKVCVCACACACVCVCVCVGILCVHTIYS